MMEERYTTRRSSRNVIDVMDIQRNFKATQRIHRKAKARHIKGVIFAFGGIVAFFLLGYAIAALGIPPWAKVLIIFFIAILGLIPGYLVSALFR